MKTKSDEYKKLFCDALEKGTYLNTFLAEEKKRFEEISEDEQKISEKFKKYALFLIEKFNFPTTVKRAIENKIEKITPQLNKDFFIDTLKKEITYEDYKKIEEAPYPEKTDAIYRYG